VCDPQFCGLVPSSVLPLTVPKIHDAQTVILKQLCALIEMLRLLCTHVVY